jgi:hypothetical protein
MIVSYKCIYSIRTRPKKYLLNISLGWNGVKNERVINNNRMVDGICDFDD